MSQEKICPTCGTEYPANERFCPRDGTALRSQSGSTDLVGSIIAERYHVLKKLGEGGMGQVYLAEHVKMGRKSAVKVMNPGMVNDADAISRFNREAANASRINHPNVAGIYDFGETPEGLIYLAMEFIEGESLTSLVETNGALTPIRAADITKQAADGLAVAHDMGIVHRDLKPDNIMIAKNRDGSDCVKVVDFGIAKAAGAENQKVTKTGLVVGTPEYMSPEQLAGDKLDGRSDVYSLALVAFNMLTGKLPFEGETAQESMIMRLTDEPRSLQAVKPDTKWSAEVQAVMHRALQRKAADRYQKASDFGVALWQAVERMPGAPRGSATQMIGTMDGATALVAAPPKTRVDPGAASVPPAVVAPAQPVAAPVARSKMPVYAGSGAVAIALAALAFVYFPKAADKTGGTLPVPTNANVPAATAVTAPQTTPMQTAGAPEPAPQSAAQKDGKDAVKLSTPLVGKETAASPTTPAPSIGDRLPALLEESEDPDKAAAALREATALQPRAVARNDVIGLSLVRAKAVGLLGKDAESCDILHAIKDRSAETPYGAKVAQLLKLSCP